MEDSSPQDAQAVETNYKGELNGNKTVNTLD